MIEYKGYATKLTDNRMFGEAILQKTNIYTKLLENLFKNNSANYRE